MNLDDIAFQIKQEISDSRGRAAYKKEYAEGRIDAAKHIAGLIAAASQVVLTIDLVPYAPLAMGRYSMVGSVRPARVMARAAGMSPNFAAPYGKSCGTCAHSYANTSAVACRLGCWKDTAASGWKTYRGGFQLVNDGEDCDTFKAKP
jgi:hypothetical protein